MKKQGFTLVEILAVIAILGLLATIITPTVNKLIKDSEENLEAKQLDLIINATRQYMLKNTDLLPEENETLNLSVIDLIEGGVIENKNIINPRTKEKMYGYINVKYNNIYNQYEYSYVDGDSRIGRTYLFDYTGSYKQFIAPFTGYYQIQAWGAQGGSALCNGEKCAAGGKGGYTRGYIYLEEDEELYIYVGGKGNDANGNTNALGGYNGGGTGTIGSSNEAAGGGGGATDIRYFKTSTIDLAWNSEIGLKSRIMVAAGGGGGVSQIEGGAGGGLSGLTNSATIHAGKQITGYQFGIGQNGTNNGNGHGVAGGGGGYYGGETDDTTDTLSTGSAGGSSYVSGLEKSIAINGETLDPRNDSEGNLCEEGTTDITCSIHYSNKQFDTVANRAANEIIPTYDGEQTTYGNEGNGYAKIVFYGSVKNRETPIYAYGTIYEELDTYCTKNGSHPEMFKDDHLELATNGYQIIYTTEAIDLTKYNTLIINKNSIPVNNRNNFLLYPERTNQGGFTLNPTFESLGNNLYVADISSFKRTDLHLSISAYLGSNSGNYYLILLSERTIDEVKEDSSFVTNYSPT